MIRCTVEDNGTQHCPQIAARLNETLARFGVAGKIRVEAGSAVLAGPGAIATTDIDQLARTWAQLPADARQQACLDIVRSLVAQRRAAAPPDPVPASGPLLQRVVPVIALVILLAGGAVVYLYQGSALKQGPLSTPSHRLRGPARDAQAGLGLPGQDDRAAGVCAQTTARVSRGATVGPTDVEGWVVELILLARRGFQSGHPHRLDQDPRLAAFVHRRAGAKAGRLVWNGARELAQLEGPNTQVELHATSLGRPAAANPSRASPGVGPASGADAVRALGVRYAKICDTFEHVSFLDGRLGRVIYRRQTRH